MNDLDLPDVRRQRHRAYRLRHRMPHRFDMGHQSLSDMAGQRDDSFRGRSPGNAGGRPGRLSDEQHCQAAMRPLLMASRARSIRVTADGSASKTTARPLVSRRTIRAGILLPADGNSISSCVPGISVQSQSIRAPSRETLINAAFMLRPCACSVATAPLAGIRSYLRFSPVSSRTAARKLSTSARKVSAWAPIPLDPAMTSWLAEDASSATLTTLFIALAADAVAEETAWM